ncbi:MAG: hypothetical protein KDB00_29735 [Planctomycetales bacterium]|nr:hypothetical protein [Planctomycetales bacterium]
MRIPVELYGSPATCAHCGVVFDVGRHGHSNLNQNSLLDRADALLALSSPRDGSDDSLDAQAEDPVHLCSQRIS